jgi:hypothetical protein
MRASSALCLLLNGVLASAIAAQPTSPQTRPTEPQQPSGSNNSSSRSNGWRRFDMNGIWRATYGTPGTAGYHVDEVRIEDDGDYITAETLGSPSAAENVFFVAIYDSDHIDGLVPIPGLKDGRPNHRTVPIHIEDANHIKIQGYPVFQRTADRAALSSASISSSGTRSEPSVDSAMLQTMSSSDSPEVAKMSANDAFVKARTLEGEENYGDALFWYERAVAKGNRHATADIGFLYQHGLGVHASMPMAA